MSNGNQNSIAGPMWHGSREQDSFYRLVSPLLCNLNVSTASKLNKTSMAPLQSMVISPLHDTWKKKVGVPFQGQTRSTIQHAHCHLSPKEVASKKSGWKADGLPYWVAQAMLRCLDAGNHSHGRHEDLATVGNREFNPIMSCTLDSVAHRKRGFTTISPLSTGRHGQLRERPHFAINADEVCESKNLLWERSPEVLRDENQFDTPSRRKKQPMGCNI